MSRFRTEEHKRAIAKKAVTRMTKYPGTVKERLAESFGVSLNSLNEYIKKYGSIQKGGGTLNTLHQDH